MTIELLTRKQADQREDIGSTPEVAPWFMTYNPIMAPEYTTFVYQLNPFPAADFCGNSPWDHHTVVSHHGIEPYAKAAGMAADAYI